MRTGIAHLPLHYGSAPRWLFDKMKRLSREISIILVSEYGQDEFLRRISDPFWLQAFGCVLGFDWHSSGLTTTVGGALKEGLKGLERELGIVVAGGKGAASRKTPQEIQNHGEAMSLPATTIENLIYASKMSAKVDSVAVQDGFQLYHHNFIFTFKGDWAVVQQGMNTELRSARRYHWLSSNLASFVEEPHSAICTEKKNTTLDLTAKQSKPTRQMTVSLIKENFPVLMGEDLKKLELLSLPEEHPIYPRSFNRKRLEQSIINIKQKEPEDFEKLLGIKGVGPKTVLALSLISELIYGTKPSWKDPARYGFAHGGKDGYPYPVQKETYERSIEILKNGIQKARIERSEKFKALKALNYFLTE
jgi:uncharacterized protein